MAEVKYGVDQELEEQADRLLAQSAGDNERCTDRDWEKLRYEMGFEVDLDRYDPSNDWDTHDSVFSILVDPGMIEHVAPKEACDGNVRARNQKMWERQRLMSHVRDTDSWGPTREGIPFLGVNEGPRKTCTRCKQSKGPACFSPRKGRRGGLQSWCKPCRREVESQKRKARKRGRRR